MLHIETITINGKQFLHTWSDKYTIIRDGVEYDDAIDPIDSGRVYSESEKEREYEP